MLSPGDPAPDFQVKDAFGRDLHLRNFRGRKVVLWFFPKANTPG
jgi:peroxiredoxin Q/BCP